MWRRGLVAAILLALTTILLMASSNSRVDDTSTADLVIAPVVTSQPKAQVTQMRRLHEEAKYAMRSLMAKHMEAAIPAKNKMNGIER